MRLRTCIFAELFGALAAVAGLAVAGHWALGELATEWNRKAEAAALSEPHVAPPRPLEPATLPVVASDPTQRAAARFLGIPDEDLLGPIERGTISRVKFNRGGSSVSLRIDFDNGSRAAFKPRQTNWQSVPRREVAAYRLNRLLGMASVPPASGRAFPREALFAAVDPGSVSYLPRLEAEVVVEDGLVVGELSWWVPVINRFYVSGYESDSTDGIVTWKRYLTQGGEIPRDEAPLVAQLSNMLLFDFVINNSDRWSGGNVRLSEDGAVLLFMDNTLSFGPDYDGHPKVRLYLERSQKFSKRLVSRLRRLTDKDVREALSDDLGPFEYLLADEEIAALLSRRDLALEYIDSLIAAYGREEVLAFP